MEKNTLICDWNYFLCVADLSLIINISLKSYQGLRHYAAAEFVRKSELAERRDCEEHPLQDRQLQDGEQLDHRAEYQALCHCLHGLQSHCALQVRWIYANDVEIFVENFVEISSNVVFRSAVSIALVRSLVKVLRARGLMKWEWKLMVLTVVPNQNASFFFFIFFHLILVLICRSFCLFRSFLIKMHKIIWSFFQKILLGLSRSVIKSKLLPFLYKKKWNIDHLTRKAQRKFVFTYEFFSVFY